MSKGLWVVAQPLGGGYRKRRWKDPNSGVVYQKDIEFQANTFGDVIPMASLLSESALKKKKKPAKMEWLDSGPTCRQLLLNFEGGATLAPLVMQTLIEFLNQQLPAKGCQITSRSAYRWIWT